MRGWSESSGQEKRWKKVDRELDQLFPKAASVTTLSWAIDKPPTDYKKYIVLWMDLDLIFYIYSEHLRTKVEE
jgi:hypothetical protein